MDERFKLPTRRISNQPSDDIKICITLSILLNKGISTLKKSFNVFQPRTNLYSLMCCPLYDVKMNGQEMHGVAFIFNNTFFLKIALVRRLVQICTEIRFLISTHLG